MITRSDKLRYFTSDKNNSAQQAQPIPPVMFSRPYNFYATGNNTDLPPYEPNMGTNLPSTGTTGYPKMPLPPYQPPSQPPPNIEGSSETGVEQNVNQAQTQDGNHANAFTAAAAQPTNNGQSSSSVDDNIRFVAPGNLQFDKKKIATK